MHVMIRFVLPVLLLLWLPSWAGAVASTLESPLTLEQCIERAVAENPQVKAYQYATKEADAGVGEAWGGFLPTLSLSYDYTNLIDNSGGKGLDYNYFDQETERFVVRVSQPLFSGLSSVAGLKKAHQSKEYSERELEFIKMQLVRQVRSTFYDVLYSRQLVEKRAESVKRLEEQSLIAEAWVKQAMAPRVHLLEVQVILSNAKQELITAETSLAIAMAQLKEWLALERDDQLEIVGNLQRGDVESCADIDTCIERALSQRLELQLMELNIEMARQDAKAIIARNLPRANLDASWTDYQRDYDDKLRPDDVRDYYTIFLNVSVQPFQGGRNIYAWRRQRATIERLENLRAKQWNTIVTEVKARYEQLHESYARLETARDGLNQAQEAYHLMSRSAELGVNSQRDLLESEVLLTRAEINQIDSFRSLQLIKAQFDFALGNYR